MKRSSTITVIDLGSNKIAAATATIERNGISKLLGRESLTSRGIRGGDITDMQKAVEDVSSIVRKLQSLQKRRIRSVFVTGKSGDITVVISRGMHALSSTPREITQRDVERCLDMASMIQLVPERVIVQKVMKRFAIDGGAQTTGNPVGLYGMRLEIEVFILTALRSKIQNITKCVDHAGLLLDGIYLSSMASAESILDEREKEDGVLMLDIGESSTEQLIYRAGALQSFRIIPAGARTLLDPDERTKGSGAAAMFEKIRTGLAEEKNEYASVVITGGGALLDGVIEAAERVMKMRARIGIAREAGRSWNSQDAIMHTSTIGFIAHCAKAYTRTAMHKNPFRKTFQKFLELYESYF